MTDRASRFTRLLPHAALAAALCMCAPATAIARQSGETSTPATMYERAQAKEQVARASELPAIKELRLAATAYERLFRDFPGSGYADNALWQAAELLSLAYQRSGEIRDRESAERWFDWLKKEYPSSPFARKVAAELRALERPVAPPQRAAAAPPQPATSSPQKTEQAINPAAPPGGPTSVKNISASPLPQGQRITIEFSQELRFTSERVDGPDRVYFDFTNATIPASVAKSAQGIKSTSIKDVRIGQPSAGVTRLVLDLAGRPRFSSYSFFDPYRLVIDVVDAKAQPQTDTPASAAAKTSTPPPASTVVSAAGPAASNSSRTTGRASGPAPPASSPAAAATTHNGEYSIGRQLGLGVSRIVIDAGHGGHDPGAMANGVTEAELVLDVAQRLAKLLTDVGGFQVVLTRNSDVFIPLEERTAIAKREDADLFLSIHANSSPDPAVRGIESYFLNMASNQSEAALAARENATSEQNMRDVPDLVKAIALNNKLKESREFAAIVQTSMMRRMSVQNKALKDLGVKQAPFRVLIGATMPSVLAEVSFLTNKNEASLLKQTTFRQRIAAALCDAITGYQASLKKVTTIAAKDGGR